MGAFEHVIALLSFVYALALTHLLSGIVALIRADNRVRFSWIYAFWMLEAFVTIFANWISFWDLRTLPSWSVPAIVLTLLMAITNYLQAALVCPEVPAEGPVDLTVFHEEQSRRYIGAFLFSCILALIANFVFGTLQGASEWGAQNLAVLPMLVAAALAMIFRARWMQIAVPIGLTATWIYYFSFLQGALK
jgi:flagellar biosynthesis protein FliQ